MLKKVRSFLLLLILLSVFLTSCTATNSDPFTEPDPSEKDGKTKEDGDAEKEDPPEDGSFVQTPPPDDFYGMTTLESLEKYGAFMFVNGLKYFDDIDGDKWYYKDALGKVENGKQSISTLYYREYPDGEPHFVCTDPLCTHSNDGCPFFSVSNFVIFEHNLFFTTKSGNFFKYIISENRVEKLAEDINNAKFIKHPNSSILYAIYRRENENFEIEYYVCRIYGSGKLENIYKMADFEWHSQEIYNDRYLLEGRFENTTASVVMIDMTTGETKNVFERDFPESSTCIEQSSFSSAHTLPYMLYGDNKLLIRIDVPVETEYYGQRTEFWLIDLSTGEKRLLAYADPDLYDLQSFHCLYSDKCIMYTAQRQAETDPLVVHFLFPETGEEEVYDVGKAAAEAGVTIPMTSYIHLVRKGAILFKTTYLTCKNGFCNTFEYDLKSGKLYCYDLPDAEEITGD